MKHATKITPLCKAKLFLTCILLTGAIIYYTCYLNYFQYGEYLRFVYPSHSNDAENRLTKDVYKELIQHYNNPADVIAGRKSDERLASLAGIQNTPIISNYEWERLKKARKTLSTSLKVNKNNMQSSFRKASLHAILSTRLPPLHTARAHVSRAVGNSNLNATLSTTLSFPSASSILLKNQEAEARLKINISTSSSTNKKVEKSFTALSSPVKHEPNNKTYIRNDIEPKDKPKRIILLYTTIFDEHDWYGIGGTKIKTIFTDSKCEYTNCELTYDHAKINDSDIVMFHGRDIESGRYEAEGLFSERTRLRKDQKWVFISYENPFNDYDFYKSFNGLFNWTATFRYSSDMPMPYGRYRNISKSKLTVKNHAEGKAGLVAWAVSHCGLIRQDYALQLQEHMKLTVYGDCNYLYKHKGHCTDHDSEKCHKELSNYKFFLAFENDFCRDYVTEKYWERLYENVVPVVMGAGYDGRLAIPKSYIDVSDFNSIKELADHLLYLDKNDTAYNEYFAWKASYEPVKVDSFIDYCAICAAIHSEKFGEPSQVELAEVFNKKKTCDEPFKERKKQIEKQVEESKKSIVVQD